MVVAPLDEGPHDLGAVMDPELPNFAPILERCTTLQHTDSHLLHVWLEASTEARKLL